VHTPPRVDGPPRSPALAASLGRIALVRGVVVCALTAYVVFGSTISPALVARLVAVYWLIDGLVALWARRFAATLATSRALLLTRGIVAIVAAVVLLALPLREVFGEWQPGQGVLFLFTIAPALAMTVLQIIMAATIDLMLGLAVRRRISGDWSVVLGSVVSIVLSVLIAVSFAGMSAALARPLAFIALVGGLGLIAGAFRLWRAG
jgi:uncharacterized membrane protein HdeD (DUF308 family)